MGDPHTPADGIDLSVEERAAIDHYDALRHEGMYYELLGIDSKADRRAVRDAYFALSKRFHPDVYFKRSVGPYRERVEAVFRAFTRAYDVLGNPKQRAAYDQVLKNEGVVSSTPKAAPFPGPPPKPTPPAGVRDLSGERRSIPSSGTHGAVPGPASRPSQPSFPAGVVVPPSLRTLLEAPQGQRVTAPPPSSPPGAPFDESARARALESMARKLGGAARKPASASSNGAPAAPTAQQIIDDRAAKVAALIARAEEAQKRNDLGAALEGFRAALTVSKDDASLKARIEAVSSLQKLQQVSDHIEQAKEAARKREFEKGATHWEKAWEGRPDDPTLLLNAAELLVKGKEHKRAAELANRAIAINPKLPGAHVVLATVYTEAGLRASARSAIEHLARLDPNHAALKDLREKLGPLTIAEQFGLRGQR